MNLITFSLKTFWKLIQVCFCYYCFKNPVRNELALELLRVRVREYSFKKYSFRRFSYIKSPRRGARGRQAERGETRRPLRRRRRNRSPSQRRKPLKYINLILVFDQPFIVQYRFLSILELIAILVCFLWDLITLSLLFYLFEVFCYSFFAYFVFFGDFASFSSFLLGFNHPFIDSLLISFFFRDFCFFQFVCFGI